MQEVTPIVPFHTYLWKIASRCNLNCTYCYIYNSADQSWKSQPSFMSEKTARQLAIRTREHIRTHSKDKILIVLHGGEPLLGGIEHLAMLHRVIQEELVEQGHAVDVCMQSNLTLLNEDIADFLLRTRIRIGTSLDGPPEWTDLNRRDHAGRPSSEAVERGLALLMRPKYKAIYSGILCVINTEADPLSVYRYLSQFCPPTIDFTLPLNNHDNRPPAKLLGSSTPYADWLIPIFDQWWSSGAQIDIRMFSSIMRLVCGLNSSVESLGLGVVDLIVIEANGNIEGLDSLKSTFEGATQLSIDIFRQSFDDAARHPMVRLRQTGKEQLCDTCKSCPVVDVCGAGYLPHRYSAAQIYNNPSVYCLDLEKIIRHIHGVLATSVAEAQQAEVCA